MLVSGISCVFDPGPDGSLCFGMALVVGVGGASIGYPATCILGLPLFIFFRIRGWLHLWQVVLGGLIVALSVGGVLSLPDAGMNPNLWLLFIGDGLMTAVAFWLIAIFRNGALTPGSSTDAPTAARG